MSEHKKIRRRRVTRSQLIHLREFLLKNKDVAFGYNKSNQDREHSKKVWQNAASILNALGEGPKKSAVEWAKYWVDFKSKVKKKYRTIHDSKQSGVPVTDGEHLTEVETMFLSILVEDSDFVRATLVNPNDTPLEQPNKLSIASQLSRDSVSSQHADQSTVSSQLADETNTTLEQSNKWSIISQYANQISTISQQYNQNTLPENNNKWSIISQYANQISALTQVANETSTPLQQNNQWRISPQYTNPNTTPEQSSKWNVSTLYVNESNSLPQKNNNITTEIPKATSSEPVNKNGAAVEQGKENMTSSRSDTNGSPRQSPASRSVSRARRGHGSAAARAARDRLVSAARARAQAELATSRASEQAVNLLGELVALLKRVETRVFGDTPLL